MDSIKRSFQKKSIPAVALVLFCMFYWGTGATAQVETTTRLSGVVHDQTGAVVPGATVTAKNQATGGVRETTTDAGGFYSIPALPPGVYTITVTHSGFKTAVVENRSVQVAAPAEVDFTLALGAVAQKVTVSAAGAELLTKATSEISQVVSPALVASLPIQRQNMFDLAALAPGAVPENIAAGSETTFLGDALNFVTAANTVMPSGIILYGNRDSAANVSIDGAMTQSAVYQQTTLLVSPADIEEMKIEGGNMNAEFGNGVTAVNVITKSGTNSYHGELYEFLRNNSLDAAPFFTNLLNQKLPAYQQNVFGVDGGGPILKNKLFFFGNYEGYRVNQLTVGYDDVLPPGVANGDFSQVPGQPVIYNPWSYNSTTGLRSPFPGNMIPLGSTTLCAPRPTCVDPAVGKYIQQWVLPANGVVNGLPVYEGLERTTMNSNQGTVRTDYNVSPRTSIYGRWTRMQVSQFGGGVEPLEGTNNPYGSSQAVMHWTQILSSHSVNDLMAAWSDPTWGLLRNTSHGNVAQEIGLQNVGSLPGAPIFSIPGYNLDTATDYLLHARENDYQLKDDFSFVSGRHNIKFGLEVRNRRFLYNDTSFDQGEFGFADIYSAACPEGNTLCTSALSSAGLSMGGSALGDFLLGAATTGTRVEIFPAPYAGYQTYFGPYVQDSWRATPRLTLNYGLRYEYWTPWLVPRNTDASWNGQTGELEYALQNPLDYLSASACYGACGKLNPAVPSRAGYTTGDHDFEPRAGVAYEINQSTVFRAGGGIFFDGNINDNQFSNIQTGMPPFTLSDTPTPAPSEQVPSVLVDEQFPASTAESIPVPNTGATFRVEEPYYPTAAVYQWSTSLEKTLGSYWSATLNYVGSHTIHEPMFMDLNSARLPQGTLASVSLQDRRIFPQWGEVGSWIPIGWAKYNAMTVAVQNRPWHGLSLDSNFTWAKNLITDNILGSDQGITNTFAPYILAGDAEITPRDWFTVGYRYELPFGTGKAFLAQGRLERGLASGWAVSGITTIASGVPQEVTDSVDLSDTGLLTAYPDRICNPNNTQTGRSYLEWFNTTCFAQPAFGTWPNSPMGAVTYPKLNDWDMSLSKTTATHFPREGGEFQFRADFFNAFNTVQWGAPNTEFTSSTFGQISSTRPAREIQFTLKYLF